MECGLSILLPLTPQPLTLEVTSLSASSPREGWLSRRKPGHPSWSSGAYVFKKPDVAGETLPQAGEKAQWVRVHDDPGSRGEDNFPLPPAAVVPSKWKWDCVFKKALSQQSRRQLTPESSALAFTHALGWAGTQLFKRLGTVPLVFLRDLHEQ